MPETNSTAGEPAANADYDITKKLSPYLDLHMMIAILDWVSKQGMYGPKSVLGAQFNLAKDTAMVDYAIDMYKTLHNTTDVPQDLTDKRAAVMERYEQMTQDSSPILAILDNHDAVVELKNENNFSMDGLKEKHGLADEDIEILYDLAKFQMDAGQYSETAKNLETYLQLAPRGTERSFQALWGLLVAQILDQGSDPALELQTLNDLRRAIDETEMNNLMKLQQRTWLVHWSLFVFFRRNGAAYQICEFFFSGDQRSSNSRDNNKRGQSDEKEFINVVRTNCPWILRYLVVAVVIKKWRTHIADLVKVIEQEKHAYSDPMTRMLQCLYVDYDLQGAQDELKKCESVLKSDFFFSRYPAGKELAKDFVMCAKKLIFRTHCLIHHKIDMKELATQLQMSPEEFEKWVVDLIRSEQNVLDDAKIDTEAGIATMDVRYPSIYERIIQKTEDLSSRSYELAQGLARARWQ